MAHDHGLTMELIMYVLKNYEFYITIHVTQPTIYTIDMWWCKRLVINHSRITNLLVWILYQGGKRLQQEK
jgi:hypothetical protein